MRHEDVVHVHVRREQLADLVGDAVDGLGEDRLRPSAQEARPVVVDALDGRRLGRVRRTPLGVPGGVAEPVQDHDRVGRHLDVVVDVVLAVILGVVVAVARRGVEPEPVLRIALEGAVGARPTVAVTEVDQQLGALQRGLDLGPRRVGAVDLCDGGAVASGEVGIHPSTALVVGGRRAGGSDHHDDLDAGGTGVARDRHGPEAGDQRRHEGEYGQTT